MTTDRRKRPTKPPPRVTPRSGITAIPLTSPSDFDEDEPSDRTKILIMIGATRSVSTAPTGEPTVHLSEEELERERDAFADRLEEELRRLGINEITLDDGSTLAIPAKRGRDELIYVYMKWPLARLQKRFEEVFGRPTSAKHKRTIAWRIRRGERELEIGGDPRALLAARKGPKLHLDAQHVRAIVKMLPASLRGHDAIVPLIAFLDGLRPGEG